MELLNVREVVHERGDDARFKSQRGQRRIGMQRVVVHLTLEQGLSLFFREAARRDSLDLGKHAITHAEQHDCCVWLLLTCGCIGAILRFEHRAVKDAFGFNENRVHRVV